MLERHQSVEHRQQYQTIRIEMLVIHHKMLKDRTLHSKVHPDLIRRHHSNLQHQHRHHLRLLQARHNRISNKHLHQAHILKARHRNKTITDHLNNQVNRDDILISLKSHNHTLVMDRHNDRKCTVVGHQTINLNTDRPTRRIRVHKVGKQAAHLKDLDLVWVNQVYRNNKVPHLNGVAKDFHLTNNHRIRINSKVNNNGARNQDRVYRCVGHLEVESHLQCRHH